MTQSLREAADLMRQRVAELVGVVVKNKMVDRDWLLETLTAPVFLAARGLG